jgi:hypothetical protein
MDKRENVTKGVADTGINRFLPEDYHGKHIKINAKL